MSIPSQRLHQCLNYLRSKGEISSPANFAKKTGIPEDNINDTLSGKSTLSDIDADTIAEHFPEISAAWLTTGEGNMTTSSAIWTRVNSILEMENQPDLKKYVNSMRKDTNTPFDESDKAATGFAECLHLVFPKYSLSWILKGDGTMITNKSEF